jgi:hypothetical protein
MRNGEILPYCHAPQTLPLTGDSPHNRRATHGGLYVPLSWLSGLKPRFSGKTGQKAVQRSGVLKAVPAHEPMKKVRRYRFAAVCILPYASGEQAVCILGAHRGQSLNYPLIGRVQTVWLTCAFGEQFEYTGLPREHSVCSSCASGGQDGDSLSTSSLRRHHVCKRCDWRVHLQIKCLPTENRP